MRNAHLEQRSIAELVTQHKIPVYGTKSNTDSYISLISKRKGERQRCAQSTNMRIKPDANAREHQLQPLIALFCSLPFPQVLSSQNIL